MIKYSAGYVKINPNFVIQNLDLATDTKPVFSILQNIITRGCPTIPSRKLREANSFGEIKSSDSFKYNLTYDNLIWDDVIKGGSNSKPALEFYEKYLVDAFLINPQFKGTFIPECSMTDIVYDYKNKKNEDSHVDFYSPLYHCVIEIDGAQHQEAAQSSKDKEREEVLNQKGIPVYHIRSNQISSYKRNNPLKEEKDVLSLMDFSKLDSHESNYLFAIRIELLLANLYANGIIKLDQDTLNVNLHTDYTLTRADSELIFEDFFDLLSNLCNLQNISFSRPKVYLHYLKSEEELMSQINGINIDISLTNVYSQAKYPNIYYIRNDYFFYQEEMHFSGDNSSLNPYYYKKNYYQISFNNVSYHISKEKHYEPLLYLLRNTSLNYEHFKDNQLEIILNLLNTRGVIGVLPTGAGKSLCYQLCALLIPSMTLTIDPLTLLMADQERNIIKNFGITNIAVINSLNKYDLEIFKNKQSLISLISPERFFSDKFTSLITEFGAHSYVDFIVIDEVHCLSEWGHDFRTSYLCLCHNLKKYFNEQTFLMALTGTASHRVFDDVRQEIKNFKNQDVSAVFADNMKRDNLNIIVKRTDSYYNNLNEVLRPIIVGNKDEKTLVFTKTKRGKKHPSTEDSACISLTSFLDTDYQGYDAENKISYYAGGDELDNDEKTQVLNDFTTGDKKIVIATKAFGMGVDIPDIRNTVHYGLPQSLESLYQEMGRAGRDGNQSNCYVFYKRESEDNLKQFFSRPLMSMKEMKEKNRYLNELNTNFYFVQSSNLDIDIEEKLILKILQEIILFETYSKSDGIETNTFIDSINADLTFGDLHLRKYSPNNDARNLIEKCLYRLFLLGEIDMWSMVYSSDLTNPIFSNLKTTKLDEKEKLKRLENHILKYESSFNFNQENTLENRVRYLINWVNENYLQERVQTMKTLYDECENYKDSASFMNFLNSYFSNDPYYTRLIENDVYDLNTWFDALKQNPNETKVRISRLLESYDKIVGLNYVSGITRLRLGEFDDPDGKERLKMSFDDFRFIYSDEERHKLFLFTYHLLDNENQRNTFTDIWLQYFNRDAKFIYYNTENEVANNFLFINLCHEILNSGGKFNDKL